MELGGNAPFIVFEDADIDAAIEGAMIAKMRNMGEACTAANRFYVHEKVHDEFAKKLTAKMSGLKMGNGLDDGVALGPLVNKDGLDKVVELVDDAVKKGAKVLTGGKAPGGPGFFYPATVLANVSTTPRCSTRKYLDRSRRSRPSSPRTRWSRAPTTPNTASSPISTPRMSAAACAYPRSSSSA